VRAWLEALRVFTLTRAATRHMSNAERATRLELADEATSLAKRCWRHSVARRRHTRHTREAVAALFRMRNARFKVRQCVTRRQRASSN
jgi:hypothetical protein